MTLSPGACSAPGFAISGGSGCGCGSRHSHLSLGSHCASGCDSGCDSGGACLGPDNHHMRRHTHRLHRSIRRVRRTRRIRTRRTHRRRILRKLLAALHLRHRHRHHHDAPFALGACARAPHTEQTPLGHPRCCGPAATHQPRRGGLRTGRRLYRAEGRCSSPSASTRPRRARTWRTGRARRWRAPLSEGCARGSTSGKDRQRRADPRASAHSIKPQSAQQALSRVATPRLCAPSARRRQLAGLALHRDRHHGPRGFAHRGPRSRGARLRSRALLRGGTSASVPTGQHKACGGAESKGPVSGSRHALIHARAPVLRPSAHPSLKPSTSGPAECK